MSANMINNIIYRGDLSPFVQSETWSYDVVRGFVHRIEYRGASQLAMKALWQQIVTQGISCTVKHLAGGTSFLDIDDATLQEAIDSWEVVANAEHRDILSHPTVLNGATDDQIALMRKHLDANDTPTAVFVEGDDGLEALNGGNVPYFYVLAQNGQTEFLREQYVLRHRTNVSARWASNVADNNVGCIYTTAQLISEASNSSLWVYPLPPRLQYKLNAIQSDAAAITPVVANYMLGWLKSPSTETTSPAGRINISTEYLFEYWHTAVYPSV